MENLKDIRNKILSIQSIQKISQAMKMIAASKLRKAQKKFELSQPYAKVMYRLISNFSLGHLEYKHPYLDVYSSNKVKGVGYIIISTDRGLVGGLNVSLFRRVLLDINDKQSNNINIYLLLIGAKAVSFFNFLGDTIVASISCIGDNPTLSELIGPLNIMLNLYDQSLINRLFMANNKFVSVLSQIPQIIQILPFVLSSSLSTKNKIWDYLYEPDPKMLLNIVLKRYVESQIYQGIVENLVSEHAARMLSMNSASDNSILFIKELKLIYNKVRQAKITQELIEIVSGGSSVV